MNREIEIGALRLYGNKDCTAMADEYMKSLEKNNE